MNFCNSSGLVCWMSSKYNITLSPISKARFNRSISSRAAAFGCFGRIERSDAVTDRRAVDFHEHDTQPVGNVFHQCCLAVTGRRNQQQQSHAIGSFIFPGCTHLLGQVVTDHRQVDFVQQSVANKAGQYTRLELLQPHLVAGLHRRCDSWSRADRETGAPRLRSNGARGEAVRGSAATKVPLLIRGWLPARPLQTPCDGGFGDSQRGRAPRLGSSTPIRRHNIRPDRLHHSWRVLCKKAFAQLRAKMKDRIGSLSVVLSAAVSSFSRSASGIAATNSSNSVAARPLTTGLRGVAIN